MPTIRLAFKFEMSRFLLSATLFKVIILTFHSIQALPTCPLDLEGDEWKSSACECSDFSQVPAKKINMDKLTVGDGENRLSVNNLGEICIKGDVQFPKGFMSKDDTLELQTIFEFFIPGSVIELPCSVVFNEIENNLEELTDDEDGNEKAEFSWVTDILSKFDQQTCTLSDICGILENAEIQKLLDKLVEENPLKMNLSSLESDSVRKPHVCSTDFLTEESYSLDTCMPIDLGQSVDLDRYKPFFALMGSESDGVSLGVELKVQKVKKDGSGEAEPILCIKLPLRVAF